MKSILLSGLAAVVLAGCAGKAYVRDTPPEGFGYVSADCVQRLEIIGRSWTFQPDQLVAVAGRPVELVLYKAPHSVSRNFTLDAPETGISISVTLTDEPQVFCFTPTKPGLYHFLAVDRNTRRWQDIRSDVLYGNLLVLPEDPAEQAASRDSR